jgi:hydrogenase maturation factor
MCLGSIALLVDAWEDGEARLGRLEDGCVVPLSYVREAPEGAYLLLHLGIPVEVLDPDAAREALALRAGEAGGVAS